MSKGIRGFGDTGTVCRVQGCRDIGLSGYRGIRVINENKKYGLNENVAKEIIRSILKYLKKSDNIGLEFVFLDDRKIREFNKRFKKKDRPTDVLSFHLEGREFGSKKKFGEIFISLDSARRNSKIFKAEFAEEVSRYMIHGVLHLLGYDDRTAAERRRMSGIEDKVLGHLCKSLNLSKVLTPR